MDKIDTPSCPIDKVDTYKSEIDRPIGKIDTPSSSIVKTDTYGMKQMKQMKHVKQNVAEMTDISGQIGKTKMYIRQRES